jgi:hypothetical protein
MAVVSKWKATTTPLTLNYQGAATSVGILRDIVHNGRTSNSDDELALVWVTGPPQDQAACEWRGRRRR